MSDMDMSIEEELKQDESIDTETMNVTTRWNTNTSLSSFNTNQNTQNDVPPTIFDTNHTSSFDTNHYQNNLPHSITISGTPTPSNTNNKSRLTREIDAFHSLLSQSITRDEIKQILYLMGNCTFKQKLDQIQRVIEIKINTQRQQQHTNINLQRQQQQQFRNRPTNNIRFSGKGTAQVHTNNNVMSNTQSYGQFLAPPQIQARQQPTNSVPMIFENIGGSQVSTNNGIIFYSSQPNVYQNQPQQQSQQMNNNDNESVYAHGQIQPQQRSQPNSQLPPLPVTTIKPPTSAPNITITPQYSPHCDDCFLDLTSFVRKDYGNGTVINTCNASKHADKYFHALLKRCNISIMLKNGRKETFDIMDKNNLNMLTIRWKFHKLNNNIKAQQ